MGLKIILGKEFRSLFREPIVVIMIVMPFVIYAGMSPFYQGAMKQTMKAMRLQGVRIAVAGCGDAGYMVAKILAKKIRGSTGSARVEVIESCKPLTLLDNHDIVLLVRARSLAQLIAGNASLEVYIKGSISSLAKTLALPGAVSSAVAKALGGRSNVTLKSYVYMSGKVWSYTELNSLYGFAMMLAYATFFILFPAASLGAALIGAEREERTLEVLFSLPIRRRDIAIAKALAAIAAAVLTAASALAGFYTLMSKGLGVGSLTANPLKYYGINGLASYIAALTLEALFVASLAMIIGLFTTSIRGAQAASSIAAFPALIPPFLLIAGIPLTYTVSAAPYMAAVLASLYPLLNNSYIMVSITFQAVETIAALAVLVKLLESEIAVTGPETLKMLAKRIRRK